MGATKLRAWAVLGVVMLLMGAQASLLYPQGADSLYNQQRDYQSKASNGYAGGSLDNGAYASWATPPPSSTVQVNSNTGLNDAQYANNFQTNQNYNNYGG